MSPIRQACYAWLSVAWTLRRQACQRLGLPLPGGGYTWPIHTLSRVRPR